MIDYFRISFEWGASEAISFGYCDCEIELVAAFAIRGRWSMLVKIFCDNNFDETEANA